MATTETALIAKLMADPKDVTARLVYADFLQEHERFEEEKHVRAVAQAIADGHGPCTLSEIRNTADVEVRLRRAKEWVKSWEKMILTAIKSELGDIYDPSGVNGVPVVVTVDDPFKEHSKFGWRLKHPQCVVRVGHSRYDKKNFPHGKNGFNLLNIVADAVKRAKFLHECNTKRKAYERQQSDLQQVSINLEDRYGPRFNAHGKNLSPSNHGDGKLVLTIADTPERMEQILALLKANDLLVG